MGQLGQRVIDRVSGPSWSGVRHKFMAMAEGLLSVSPEARGELTTIYVKFAATSEPTSAVYAVAWIRTVKRWVIGLALPDGFEAPELGPVPSQKYKYAGLTGYFTLTPADAVPKDLSQWAKLAYQRVTSET